ncbi:MAG: hypothetical protein WBV69_10855 [Candidatus Sulfotelmatobacter sp.]
MPENTIRHTTSQQFTEKPSQDVCNVPTRFSSSYFCALYTLEHTRSSTASERAQRGEDWLN